MTRSSRAPHGRSWPRGPPGRPRGRSSIRAVRPAIGGCDVRTGSDALLVWREGGVYVFLVVELPSDRRLEQAELAIERRLPLGRSDRLQVLERSPQTARHLRRAGARESNLVKGEPDVPVPADGAGPRGHALWQGSGARQKGVGSWL